MKKPFFFLTTLLITITSHTYSQDLKWNVALFTGPVIHSQAEDNQVIEASNSLGISAGLELSRHFSERLSVSSGGHVFSTPNIFDSYNFISIDQNDPIIPEKTEFSQVYLTVPVLVSIKLLSAIKQNLSLGLGYSKLFMVSNEAVTTFQAGNENTVTYPTSNGSSIEFRVEYAYHISEKLSLTASPTFSYFTGKYNSGNLKADTILRGLLGASYSF